MGIRKRFNKEFGLEDTIDQERKRFVKRVNQAVFHTIDTTGSRECGYGVLFKRICFELGVNANDVWQRHYRKGDDIRDHQEYPPEIRNLTHDEFDLTLLVLCILHGYLSESQQRQEWLSKTVQNTLSRATCNLGVRWKDGFFCPSGAEELDDVLVDDTLTWLSDYPNEKRDFRNALSCLLREDALDDVIKSCYSALEGTLRNVLGNKKTLDNNKEELLSTVGLSQGWKSILASYIQYAHDFRHASEERHKIRKEEAEAYLYMTGLVIRLLSASSV